MTEPDADVAAVRRLSEAVRILDVMLNEPAAEGLMTAEDHRSYLGGAWLGVHEAQEGFDAALDRLALRLGAFSGKEEAVNRAEAAEAREKAGRVTPEPDADVATDSELIEIALVQHLGPEYDSALAALDRLAARLQEAERDRAGYLRDFLAASERVETAQRERDEARDNGELFRTSMYAAEDAAGRAQLLAGTELTRRQAAEAREAALREAIEEHLSHPGTEYANRKHAGLRAALASDESGKVK